MFVLRCAGTVLASALLGAALSSSRVSAQSLKLNGALAQLRAGNVTDYRFTSDGARMVYRADRSAAGVFELFSVPTDFSAPSVRLNGPLPAGGSVGGAGALAGFSDFAIGAGDRVAYRADQTTVNTFELYSVPADGSADPLRLSPAPVSVYRLWLTPGGDEVFFSDQQSVHRVPLDGSSGPVLVARFPANEILFSPDGSWAILNQGPDDDVDRLRLYSMPLDGGVPPLLLQVSDPFQAFVSLAQFEDVSFASDGAHVLYNHDFQFEGESFIDLYSARLLDSGAHARAPTASPLSGRPLLDRAPTRLNPTQHAAGAFALDEDSPLDRVAYVESGAVFSASYDGARVPLSPPGWVSDDDRIAVSGTDVVFGARTGAGNSVLRAPLDGSASGVPLYAPGLASFPSVRQIEVVDSQKVVFLGGPIFEPLYVVPLAGGTPVLLNSPVVNEGGPRSFSIHPNGQRVAFIADPDRDFVKDLFVTPLDGSLGPRKLNAPVLPDGDVESFSFSPDGASVAYLADPAGNSVHGVFRASLDGSGSVTRFDEPAPDGPATGASGDVLDFLPTPDGTRVVYRADGESDERFELFAVGAFGRENPVPLTAHLPRASSALPGFVLSPSGERVVFQAGEPTHITLRSVATTPGSTPIELDSSPFELALPLAIAPDGTRVVYRARAAGLTDHALRSAPIDGSSPALALHPPFPAGQGVIEFQISPDSRFVVYRADAELDEVFELFQVPLDGSADPVRLHAPLAAGRAVRSFRISPDGARVVFRADLLLEGRIDLFSVPADGPFAPQKVDGPVHPLGDVTDFAISPDGRTVVYRANASGAPQFDLFSVPIQGHRAVRRSTGEAGGGVARLTQVANNRQVATDFRFSFDGKQVLYRANVTRANTFDVFRVAVGGRSAPVRVSTVPADRTTTSFALGPDQSRVVYIANSLLPGTFELFSVALGGGPAVRLDPKIALLGGSGDVSSFRIDVHSRRVVYLADRDVDELRELFAVPIDGSAPAERLNRPLPANGDVESDYALLPGGRVLYRADQEKNDVLELFVSLERPVLPR